MAEAKAVIVLCSKMTALASAIARSTAVSQFAPAPMLPMSDDVKHFARPRKSCWIISLRSAAYSASSEM
jgi:hypothetical protein